MEIKIAIDNEIEIPGTHILRMFAEMQQLLGHKEVIKAFENSKLFIYKSHEGDVRMMLIPDCDCRNCTIVGELIREALRTDKMSESDICQMIEKIQNNHD